MSATDPIASHALDSVDQFLEVGSNLADMAALAEEAYRGAANDLYLIARKLLESNENLVKLLNRFIYFDFRAADAREKYLALAQEYENEKSSPEFHRMKFNCGDIKHIYIYRLKDQLDGLVLPDSVAADQIAHAFEDLGDADGPMIAFIYDSVVGAVDGFLAQAGRAVDRLDYNSAESARLAFKVDVSGISGRLTRLANGLSDLIIRFAAQAHRPVTLEEPV